jgi:hypothetical protein
MTGPSVNPYTTQSSSGYNASPPADDGSQVTANLVGWAGILTKLTDVLKTFTEAVNAAVLSAFAKSINCDDAVQNVIGGSIALESDELTISAGGAITPDKSHHTVDTNADAASDDLANVLTTSVADETILILRAAHTDRTVVVKDAATGAGQIHLQGDADYSLDDTDKSIILQRRGTDWYELTRSVDATGKLKQAVKTQVSAYATGTTQTPFDDTIPQITEGDEYMTLAITPTSATNILVIMVDFFGSHDTANRSCTLALFQDATAAALAATADTISGATGGLAISLTHTMTAGTTSSTTFRVRFGAEGAGTSCINGNTASRIFGGVAASSITILEYEP